MPEITDKELSTSAKPLWLKALSSVETKNYAYAISIIQAILKESPGFLAGREILRKCESNLTGGPKKKSKLFGISTAGGAGMKLQSQAKKDPEGTLPLIEKELETDPYNESLNELLHECFIKLELFDSAAFALETIRKGHPDNVKSLHKLALFYLQLNRPDAAGEVYADIIKVDPTDSVAVKGSKDCAAQHSMQSQRWDEKSDMRSLMKNQSEFLEMEQASRSGLTMDQLIERRDRMIQRYNEDPNQLAVSKDLAAIFEQLEDWQNASSFYSWAHSLSNGDVALKAKAGAMADKAAEQYERDLEKAIEEDPNNDELRAQLDELRRSRSVEKVENAKQRVEENPTDPYLRYELGKAYYDAGDYGSAIPHLQQATRNPHIRTKVLLTLGRTFRAKSMYDLAIKQLSDALADLHAMDNTKKEVLYEKGLIHMEMGDKVAALDSFKQIYEVDYGYRDVAQRVESSYNG